MSYSIPKNLFNIISLFYNGNNWFYIIEQPNSDTYGIYQGVLLHSGIDGANQMLFRAFNDNDPIWIIDSFDFPKKEIKLSPKIRLGVAFAFHKKEHIKEIGIVYQLPIKDIFESSKNLFVVSEDQTREMSDYSVITVLTQSLKHPEEENLQK